MAIDPAALWRAPALDLAEAVKSGALSAAEVTAAQLDRIATVNPRLNAVTDILADTAREEAARIDAARAAGEALGPLAGVPISIKENVDVAGRPTTHGVSALKAAIAPGDCTLVARLRAAGAVIVGRTNTADFGLRWHTRSELHGHTVNPHDASLTPGGSSGGAASALAAGLCALSHGNDIGGSLRYPAQACGVHAIKPTLGRIGCYHPSARGERPPAMQLLSAQGPMARTIPDLRVMLDIMAARDTRDPWWSPAPLLPAGTSGPCRVALAADFDVIDPDIAATLQHAAKTLAEAGYHVEAAMPPDIDEAAMLWAALVLSETPESELPNLKAVVHADTFRFFQFIRAATLPLDLRDFFAAFERRTAILRRWLDFMETYPLVLSPVSLIQPFKVDQDVESAESAHAIARAQRMVVVGNLLGLPAVTATIGAAGGIPQGVQLFARPFREDQALDAAAALETAFGAPRLAEPA